MAFLNIYFMSVTIKVTHADRSPLKYSAPENISRMSVMAEVFEVLMSPSTDAAWSSSSPSHRLTAVRILLLSIGVAGDGGNHDERKDGDDEQVDNCLSSTACSAGRSQHL
uniref:Uncharacterized protein n=1 Tax=Attheya septentrionalis TaxID=420275 RepID=A0A7S2XP19_9STRA